MLLKEVIVAKAHPQQASQRHVYFQYGPDDDEAREGVYITRKNWDELGRPDVITVSIEAGHNLDEEEHQRLLLEKIPSRVPNVPLTFSSPSGD